MGDVQRKGSPKHLPQNKKHGEESKHAQDSTAHHLLLHHSSTQPKHSGLLYFLPSYADMLFTNLQSLREAELLLDLSFCIQRNSFCSHGLVLAAASECPRLFFNSTPNSELGLTENSDYLTPLGLGAVLQLAYYGYVALEHFKEGEVVEVLNACQYLQMERLRRRCTQRVTTSASKEREKSLTIIKDMWDKGVACDIIIQADSGERYSAHRVVLAAGGDYFRALLCEGLRESREDIVCLRGLSSWVIEAILGFFYTGQLRLDWGHIWELTDALHQFQLKGAFSLCTDFLQDRMDDSTCLDVLVLAETCGLLQLGQAAEDYALAHFQHISAGEKFKDVPYVLLHRLLDKDSLCVDREALVLVGGDTVDDDFVKRVPSQSLWYAQHFHRGPGLIRKIDWKLLTEIPEPARFRHSVCLLDNKLYILGGRKYYGSLDILKSAVRLDLTQLKWEQLPDMQRSRDYFAAVCLDARVFVLVGNYDNSRCLDDVEYYSPVDYIWRLDHPLETAISGHAAAVLNGHIYISGGCDADDHCRSSMWAYHPSRGCFPRAPMSVGAGRAGHVMLPMGNRLVVAGGLHPLWMGVGDQLLCEVYDPACDSWSFFPALPRPHLSPGGTVLDGRLYVAGGSSANTARDTKWVHCYDPKKECWENLGAMPHPYTDLAVCSLPLPSKPHWDEAN